MLEKVKKIIDDWDPIGLLELGCPNDEYDIETHKIFSKITGNMTCEELSSIIKNVFIEMFSKEVFTKDDLECSKIARLIIDDLSKNKND